MLDGFLTTALELIIILDVCGAIIYVVAVSLRRAKQKQAEQADAVPTTPGLAYGPTLSTATAAPLSAPPPPLPEWAQEAVSRHDAVTDVRSSRDAGTVSRPVIDVTIGTEPSQPETDPALPLPDGSESGFRGRLHRLTGNIRQRLSDWMQKLTWKRKQGQEKPERTDIESDRARLHHVLNSFREDA